MVVMGCGQWMDGLIVCGGVDHAKRWKQDAKEVEWQGRLEQTGCTEIFAEKVAKRRKVVGQRQGSNIVLRSSGGCRDRTKICWKGIFVCVVVCVCVCVGGPCASCVCVRHAQVA